jgi:hypothetical protein
VSALHKRIQIIAFILIFLPLAVTLSKADNCEFHYKKAQEYLKENKFLLEEAIYELKIASQDSLLVFDCYKLLGEIYATGGNFEEAKRAFEFALERNPSDIEVKRKLALAYYRNGEFTKSLELYERLPQDPEVLYYLGSIYAKKNMWDKALEYFKMLQIEELKLKDTTWTNLAEEQIKTIDGTCSPRLEDLGPEIQNLIKSAPSQKDYPNAGAIILLKEKHLTVSDNSSQLEEHCLIKILDSRGKEEFGEIKIKYDDTYEIVDINLARIITPEGRVSLVSKKYFKDVTPWSGFPEYSNSKIKIISFPQVEEGSVIEYRVTKHNIKLLNQNDFSMKSYLQTPEPTLLQTYIVTFPKDRKIHIKLLKGAGEIKVPDPKIIVDGNRETIKWEIGNVPEVLQEEDMPPWDEIIPQIWVSSFESWTEIYNWWTSIYRDQIKPDKAIVDKVTQLISDKNTEREKAKAIYEWVATNIRYVALEYGEGGYEPHAVSEVFKNRYGDCKDQTCLLISMLRQAGIEAYPALIGTYTVPVVSDIPMLQFNHCIGAAKIDNEYVFLDPISETCPFGYVPASDQGQIAMVFLDNTYKFMKVPLFEPERNKDTREMKILVNKDRSIEVEKKGIHIGENGIRFKYWLKGIDPTKRKESLEEEISQSCPGSILKDCIISNLDDLDSPLAITEKFYVPNWLHDIGDGKLTFKLPTVVIDIKGTDKEERRYPIWYEYTRSKEYDIEVILPKGYKAFFLSKSLDLKTPYSSFAYHIENQDNTIKIHISWRQDTTTIPLKAYREYKEFSEKISRKLNEEIILIKNGH